MSQTPTNPLGYSTQPPSSLAICQPRPGGGVHIEIPPPIHRTLVRVILALEIMGCLVGPPLLIAALVVLPAPSLILLASAITAVSYATLVVTLWMGFRWTIIEAGPDGLRLELRGLLFNRKRFFPRHQIGQLRKIVSLLIFDPSGQRIGKIDATDPGEEIWLMQTLRQALNLPAE